MRHIAILSLATVLAFLSGCSNKPSASFKLEYRQVTIKTEPAGARVIQLQPLGQPSIDLGVTPLIERPIWVHNRVKMKHMSVPDVYDLMEHTNTLVAQISLEGYETQRVVIATDSTKVVERTITLMPKKP